MSDNRSRVRTYICKVCGRAVRLTNFMRRHAVTPEGEIIRTNTHELTHVDAEVVPRDLVPHAEILDAESRKLLYYKVVREG